MIRKSLQERLAKLAGGVAVLYVGAPTEVEMKEKKDRVDDALAATRAAVEEGVVAGGGVALLRAIEGLDKIKTLNEDETTGVAIVKRAAEEPLRQIIANAGQEGAVIVQEVKAGKDDFGYNARTEKFENLVKAGVVDPTKVTRIAVENAASIAAMLINNRVCYRRPTRRSFSGSCNASNGRWYARNDVSLFIRFQYTENDIS